MAKGKNWSALNTTMKHLRLAREALGTVSQKHLANHDATDRASDLIEAITGARKEAQKLRRRFPKGSTGMTAAE